MKKLIALISALALLLLLCACSGEAGGAESERVSTEPEASRAVSENPTQDVQPSEEAEMSGPPEASESPEPDVESPPSGSGPAAPVSVSEPVENPPSTSVPPSSPAPVSSAAPTTAELKAIAESLIDHPVSELYAAIGQPLSADYAPGCVKPDSEDGELMYSGFTVYTVRTATEEYVYDVA